MAVHSLTPFFPVASVQTFRAHSRLVRIFRFSILRCDSAAATQCHPCLASLEKYRRRRAHPVKQQSWWKPALLVTGHHVQQFANSASPTARAAVVRYTPCSLVVLWTKHVGNHWSGEGIRKRTRLGRSSCGGCLARWRSTSRGHRTS